MIRILNEGCNCIYENHTLCAKCIPIFASLSDKELEQVVSLIVQKRYKKDTMIFSEGSIAQDLIIVSKGKVKIYGHSQDGKEQIMYILTQGDFFGARNLIYDQESDFNVQAMEDAIVCTIEKHNFQMLLEKFPSISIKMMEVLCERLVKMESMFRRISPKDVDSRINMMLLELSHKYGRKQSEGILVNLPMNREEMANYIGVARETVSRKIKLLKDSGIIKIVSQNMILIVDEEALENSI